MKKLILTLVVILTTSAFCFSQNKEKVSFQKYTIGVVTGDRELAENIDVLLTSMIGINAELVKSDEKYNFYEIKPTSKEYIEPEYLIKFLNTVFYGGDVSFFLEGKEKVKIQQ